MSGDPIIRLAQQRAVSVSADIEAQLLIKEGCRPVLQLLVLARNRAAEALTALAFVEPDKPEDIRALQNEVKIYDNLVAWTRKLVTDGMQADDEITAEDREEMIDLLAQSGEVKEAVDLGLLDAIPHDA